MWNNEWGMTMTWGSFPKSIFLALAASLFSSAAFAATPILSGSYILSMEILCQAGLKVTKDSNSFVRGLGPNYEARLETDIGTATFNNATKRVTISGFAVFGQTLQVTGTTVTNGNMHETALSSSTKAFSNTATAITLGNETSRIVYGKVTNGIAEAAVFQRFGGSKAPNDHCALKGTILRK